MVRYLRLLVVFLRTSLQTDMEYRADFFTRVLASILTLVGTVGSLWIVFLHAKTLAGWTFPEVLMLLSVYYMMIGILEVFIAPNMRQTMDQIRLGTLDFVLLKPESAQFLASFRTISIWQSSNVLVGLGLTLIAIRNLSLHIGFAHATVFAATIACGIAILYSFWLILITLTFWFVKVDNVEQMIWQAIEAGRYPVDIYPLWLRQALTYVIPVAFIITVPARAMVGRTSLHTVAVAMLAAVLTLAFSSWFWRFGLRHYTGASA